MPRRFRLSAAAALLALASTAALAGPARPPLASYPETEQAGLAEAYRARAKAEGAAYDPRTAHRAGNGAPRFVNRLILEASPYLRQHAHNPVDWRPWGSAALAEAKAANKPIFLSVGYAACHWCHVMAEESFDALDVAAALNRDFIAVKVDREASPGVDETYMLATALLTGGGGGWPNSVWLTPEGEPFFAGTYFPKRQFLQVLDAVSGAWREEREAVRKTAGQLAAAMRAYQTRREAAASVGAETYAAARAAMAERFNALQGGFSDEAQFPFEVYLQFLIDDWRRDGDAQALAMATTTLDAILAGGIHDHVGGGFHRYAIDPGWDVPHFEKMLYNQAEIVRALIAAWEATGAPRYRRGAERALDYVLREMRAPDGAFYAAEDAASLAPNGKREGGEREEGAFYLWSAETLDAALAPLGEADRARARESFELVGHPSLAGAALRVSPEALETLPALDPVFAALRAARAARPRPPRDEKIIAGWNGAMIRALAEAAAAFDRPDYAAAARRAAEAVWGALWTEDGLRRFTLTGARGGGAPAALQDYAWLGLGLLALHDLDGAKTPLMRARLLAGTLAARFADGAGRLKMTEADGPLGPVYRLEDGATASGESLALELFALLARREAGMESRGRAEALLAALSGGLAARPAERPVALIASRILSEGESAPRRTLAAGKLRVAARREGGRVRIDLAVQKGWHLNAAEPLQSFLVPTRLEGAGLGAVAYPAPREKRLGFSDAPIRIIEGAAAITAPLSGDGAQTVRLTTQVCSDEICLVPETALFRLPPR